MASGAFQAVDGGGALDRDTLQGWADKTGVADGGIPYLFGVIGVDLLTAACVARAGPRITRWARQGAWAALRVGGRAAAAA